MRSRARRRDANEPDIVKALRGAGASVTLQDGKGEPDLLVGYRRVTYLLEVKMPLGVEGGLPHSYNGIGGRGDLTADQVEWWDAWRGAPPAIVRSPLEALQAIGAPAAGLHPRSGHGGDGPCALCEPSEPPGPGSASGSRRRTRRA